MALVSTKEEKKHRNRLKLYESFKTFIPSFLSPAITPFSVYRHPFTSVLVSYCTTGHITDRISTVYTTPQHTVDKTILKLPQKRLKVSFPEKFSFTAPGSFNANLNLNPCCNGKKNNKSSFRKKKRTYD
ncbi:hypothetical protein NEPAR06_0495 [Nematocida parisii]|uniref:Uncharacterized protein n=1 Tax=Nematocida parisii (strain ERTm3) TaxID=935791 RepID=I3EJG1_NEMP3|nr:uncharacterized protein NEPG_01111 [Nematocida parisii ERTm1]EIJ89358.1 hypothetical protein NEQG_00128 [Nematocida parisii ERTm3]KAI5127439.1 hypothetical protein NEPAR08_0880 [Nematocida parisii]EIJ94443.1 hypothetical protein NEPG_01111 [Nematocida parisii ERTm1]KAI5129044.1 hypothetical protein NEPAR03_1490 [Nematocida parisii]KAI5141318.1 hypothetical protein NEPAR04_0880 [Nematocida parisii]|eukprot:XP_013058939.1 hypothetical protein NEPG_01111 [Nematocida parisii ERTm1]